MSRSSTTGPWIHCPDPSEFSEICGIGTRPVLRSEPRSSPCRAGTSRLAIPRSRMPSSTVWPTILTAAGCVAIPRVRTGGSRMRDFRIARDATEAGQIATADWREGDYPLMWFPRGGRSPKPLSDGTSDAIRLRLHTAAGSTEVTRPAASRRFRPLGIERDICEFGSLSRSTRLPRPARDWRVARASNVGFILR